MSDESAEAFARRLERETAEQFNQAKAPPKPRAKKASKKLIDASESTIFEALRTHAALQAGAIFKLDTFAGQIRVLHPIPVKGVTSPAFKPHNLTDIDITHLMMWLQDNGYVKVSSQKTQRAVEAEAHRNSYSSAQEELGRQPAWDGVVRLDRLWTEGCGAVTWEEGWTEEQIFSKQRYLAAVGRSFFISLVKRIMEPGCKVDHMPVLEGPQGSLKSTLLRTLCLRPEWFTDNLGGDVSSKDAKQHLAGKLIIELSEMMQLSRTSPTVLKGFLTMQEDEYRPPYGRNPILQPRQCVFTGTTNQNNYFKDDTGNRRFWPITCGTINLDLIREWLPQLYAEAIAAHASGEQCYLSPDLELLAQEEQNERLTDDPWEEAVLTAIDEARGRARNAQQAVFWVTTADALSKVNADKGTWDETKVRRVHVILKKKGGENRRLPRDGTYQKWGFRFVTGLNGGDYASHASHGEALTH